MSIAGGYYKAVEAAHAAGCDCVQLFTKNNSQWRARSISDSESDQFKAKLSELAISDPISHASYLINLASPDAVLRHKSIDAMVIELQRAERLGIPYVVVHPGSYTTSDEATGLKTIADSLNDVLARTEFLRAQCLLENTAGQGSNLGWKFEHLSTIIRRLSQPERVGVCVDTCHAFAAGYELTAPDGYATTMRKIGRTVGFRRVKAFHLNDSKKPFASRRDRHEHIGRGEIGLGGFRNLLNDPRWKKTPMYLETPKGTEEDRDLDQINLETLRACLETKA